MSGFRLSRRADADLIDIAEYTFGTWGDAKAIAYVNQLEAACGRAAENPGLARGCDHIRPGYCRLEEGRHVLFLKIDPDGVLNLPDGPRDVVCNPRQPRDEQPPRQLARSLGSAWS